MPGHKDPEGVIKEDEKGLLYVEVVREEAPKPVEEEPAPRLKKKSIFDKKKV